MTDTFTSRTSFFTLCILTYITVFDAKCDQLLKVANVLFV